MPPQPTPRQPRPTPRQPSQNTATVVRAGSLAVPALPAIGAQRGVGAVRVYDWGAGNNLPQLLLRLIYDSGTAEACQRILAQFIGGEGFADPRTASARANPEQTFNELLAEAKHYAALGIGVAFALRFSYAGTDPDIYVVAADCLRRERDGSGRFVLNEGLAGGTFKPSENQLYLPYHPTDAPADLAAEVLVAAESPGGYWGHLWWSYERRVGRHRYPVPHWYAGREDVESDAALPKFDRKQVTTAFMPDAIITLVGEKYNDVPDERWEPRSDETEADRPYVKSPHRLAVEAALRALKGVNSESSIMLNTVDEPDEKPQIDWVDRGPNSKGLTDMRQRIEGAVYRRFGVPPVLDGVAQAGQLGNNQQIVNSIQLFGLVVKPARATITEPLARLRPDLDFTVKPLNPVLYLDPTVAAKLTDAEIRQLADFPAEPKEADTPTPTPKPAAS